MCVSMCMCVYVCACVYAHVCVCACVDGNTGTMVIVIPKYPNACMYVYLCSCVCVYNCLLFKAGNLTFPMM